MYSKSANKYFVSAEIDDEQCKEGILQSPVSTVDVVFKVFLKKARTSYTKKLSCANFFFRSESIGFTKRFFYVVAMFYR